MQKFLRTLMLAAVMLLPLASQAQGDCTPISTFPVTYGFEESEGFTTIVTGAAACTTNVFNSCWRNEATVSVGSYGTRIWHIYGGTTASQIHSGAHSLMLPDKGSTTAGVSTTMLTFPAMSFTNAGGYVVSFWIYRSGTSSNPEGFKVYASNSDTIDASAVELGHYSRNRSIAYPVVESTTGWYQYETAPITLTGTVYIIFEGQSYYGSSTYVDDIVISEAPSCFKVTDLAINAALTTANSLTLTWTDALNTGATYTIYDMSDTSVVATGITGTTYTVTGLTANTAYSFAVMTDCGGGDVTGYTTPVSGRTACEAIATLPYTCGFEASEIVATTPNADALPFCWSRYASGTGSYTYFPYSFNSSTYAHGGSRLLYFYDGTSSNYPDTMVAILPELDVTIYPMNANRLTFWGRVSTGTNEKSVLIGTMTDPTDMNTFALVETVAVSGTTQTLYSVPLTNASATAPYLAIMLVKSSTGYLCIDDLTVEEMPSCLEVSNVAVSDISAHSMTLSWSANAANNNATYTVWNMNDTTLIGTAITDTFYIIDNLQANTLYTFGVEVNCANGDASVMTVSGRTACDAEQLPFVENFDANLSSNLCWRGASNITADSAFNGGTLTLTNPTSWTYASSTRDGLELGHYYKNVYGTAIKHWLITPPIDLSNATAPQLTFDVALTDYNAAALPDANGDTNTSQAFYVIVSTDGGNTWLEANATKWQNVAGANYTYASLASTTYQNKTIDLTQYVGSTIKIAFYCQSLWTGGDNDLHIDNISVAEIPNCPAVTGLTLDSLVGTTAYIRWNDNGSGYNVEVFQNDTAITTNWIIIDDTTATIGDLTVDNDYQIMVRSVCGAETGAWSTPLNIHVGYCLPNPTSIDGQGITSVSFGNITSSIHPTSAPYYIDNSDMIGNVPAGTTCTMSIEYSTGSSTVYSYGTIIWVDWDNSMSFDANEVVYRGTSAQGSGGVPQILTATFDIPATTPQGSYRMRIAGADSYFDSYVNDPTTTPNPCFTSTYAVAEDYTLNVTAAPDCMAPLALTASAITADEATLSWNGDAAMYNVYLATATDTTFVQTVGTNTVTLTGLTAMTSYTYAVTTVCGSDESDMVFVTFTTACSSVTLPFVETFDATSASRDCWTLEATGNIGGSTGMGFVTVDNREVLRFSSYSSASDYNQYGYSPVMNASADATGLNVSIVYATRTSDYLYFGYIDGTDTVWFSQEYNTGSTSSNMVWDTMVAVIPASATQLAVHYYGNYQYYAWIDNVEVTELTVSYCYPVTNVTVDNATSSSVSLSWTDANNTGATYTVYNMADTSVVATNISTNNYEVTGLSAMTGYTFGVVANCSADNASNIATVSAATACSGASCQITIIGADSWGDGWNGNAINVMQNGALIGTFTLASGSSYSETYSVCSGTPVSFAWVAGSYASETSFEILDGGNTTVYTGAGSDMVADSTFCTIVDACPSCIPVAYIDVDTVTLNSVTISWTGNAASYDVYNGDTYVASVTTNTYTFTGLTAGTMYAFGVQAICSSTDSATAVYTYVMTECADITTLPYTEGFEMGLGCWTTVNGSADGMPWNYLSQEDYAHTGDGSAISFSYYSGAIHANAWLISPKFVLPTAGDSLTLSWWHKVNAYYPTELYDVMISTTTNDTSAFTTTLLAVSPDSTDSYVLKSVDLSAYAGQQVYIAFHHHDSYDQNYLCIDDVSLTSGGLPPVQLDTIVVNVAVNDATMGTTDPAPGVHYFVTGDTLSVVANANAGYHLEGWTLFVSYNGVTVLDTTVLTQIANPFYYMFGQIPVIGEGDGAWAFSVTANFAVDITCDVINTFPYTQDFSTVPACWNTIDADGDGFGWELISGAMHSASYDNDYGVLTPDNWLITPQFQLAAGTQYEVTWNANPQDINWPSEHYGLFVSTTGTDTSNFTLVQDWTLTAAGHTPVVNLSSYAGQTVYLAFRHWNCSDMYRIAIDNFQLRVPAASNQITVTLTQNNPMYGSVSGSGIYTIGDSVTISATPASGYYFQEWVNSTGTVVSTANPYTFVAATDVTLMAVFDDGTAPELDSMLVNVAVNDATMGTTNPAPGAHYFYTGEDASVVAIPNDGYHLEGWSIYVNYTGYGVVMDTTLNISVEDVFDLFGGWEVEYGDGSYVWTVTANFAAGSGPETHDSLTITMGVNDINRGTVYPSVGTHYYVEDDVVVLGAVPNAGFYISAIYENVYIPGYGMFSDTLLAEDMEIEPGEALIDTLVVDEDYIGMVMDIYVVFTPIDQPDSVWLTVTVNNTLMGTTNPEPGMFHLAAGETMTFTAVPYDGYQFSSWSNGATTATVTVTVDYDMTLTATFVSAQGIDEAETVNVNAYGKDGNIVLQGAEGREVYVFDINGRMLHHTATANVTELYNAPASGVYLIKIEGVGTKRVVIVK